MNAQQGRAERASRQNKAGQEQGRTGFGEIGRSESGSTSLGLSQDIGEDKDWGSVKHVQEGSRTPWGAAQYVSHPVDGIVSVGCAGHGGMKLSDERNRAIPTPLRNTNGWYEEDCEVSIVGMYHPEAFDHFMKDATDDDKRDSFAKSVKAWFPETYEAATGEEIPFGVSSEKDEKDYYAKNAGKTFLYSTGARESKEFPGYVNVTTGVGNGPGADRFATKHLVPLDAYNAAQGAKHGAASVRAVLPEGSIDITPPKTDSEKADAETGPLFHGIDMSGMTDSQRSRANADLNKRWRDRETGEIFTLRERIETDGSPRKTIIMDNGKSVHYIGNPDGSIMQVSKAAWDAVEAPDDRTEGDRLLQKRELASAAFERVRWDYDPKKRAAAKAKLDAATSAYDAVYAVESAARQVEHERRTAETERIASETARAAFEKATGRTS
jgi:hypothetical protein